MLSVFGSGHGPVLSAASRPGSVFTGFHLFETLLPFIFKHFNADRTCSRLAQLPCHQHVCDVNCARSSSEPANEFLRIISNTRDGIHRDHTAHRAFGVGITKNKLSMTARVAMGALDCLSILLVGFMANLDDAIGRPPLG